MRKNFDSLHALVRDHLQLDVFAGHLFAFANKRRNRIKILYWDRDGMALWSKRLEEGTYAWPMADADHPPGAPRELNAAELGALLSGIDLARAPRRKRYTRPA
jgi:transposase